MATDISIFFTLHFYVFPYNDFIINQKIKNFDCNGLIVKVGLFTESKNYLDAKKKIFKLDAMIAKYNISYQFYLLCVQMRL